MKDIRELRGDSSKKSSLIDEIDLLDALADHQQNRLEPAVETESLLLRFKNDKEKGGLIGKHLDAHRKTKKAPPKNFSDHKSR